MAIKERKRTKVGSTTVRLPKRWKDIVDLWAIDPDHNKTSAYQRVMEVQKKSAQSSSSVMFRVPEVAEYAEMRMQQLRDMAEQKFKINSESLLLLLTQMVTFDPRKCVDDQGNAIRLSKMGDAEAMALDGFEVVESESAGTIVTKMKFAKRYDGIDKMMRHLGMFEKDNEQVGDAMAAMLDKINEGGQGSLG